MDLEGEWDVFVGDDAERLRLSIADGMAIMGGRSAVVAFDGHSLTVSFEPVPVAGGDSFSRVTILARVRDDGFAGIFRHDLQGPDGTPIVGDGEPADEPLAMQRPTGWVQSASA